MGCSPYIDEVKRAFRQLALIHHPDKPGGDGDTFKIVQEAYVVGLRKSRKQPAAVVADSATNPQPKAAPPPAAEQPRATFQPQVDPRPKAEPPQRAEPPPKPKPKAKPKAKPDAPSERPSAGPAGLAATKRLRPGSWPMATDGPDGHTDKAMPDPVRAATPEDPVKAKSRKLSDAKSTAIPKPLPRATSRGELQPQADPRPTLGHLKSEPVPKAKSKAKAKAKHEVPCDRPVAGEVFWIGRNASGAGAAKRARPMPWAVAVDAPPAKIRKAVERYEDDAGLDKTMPDMVRAATPAELAAWLRAGSCIPVDVREAGAQSGVEIQGARQLSYSKVIFSADEAATDISSLRAEGKRIVLFCEQPGTMGTCGMVGAILLDVFGFSENLVFRLDGGCVAWESYLDANPSVARTVETLVMRMQRRQRSAAARVDEENAMADASAQAAVHQASSAATRQKQQPASEAARCDIEESPVIVRVSPAPSGNAAPRKKSRGAAEAQWLSAAASREGLAELDPSALLAQLIAGGS